MPKEKLECLIVRLLTRLDLAQAQGKRVVVIPKRLELEMRQAAEESMNR